MTSKRRTKTKVDELKEALEKRKQVEKKQAGEERGERKKKRTAGRCGDGEASIVMSYPSDRIDIG